MNDISLVFYEKVGEGKIADAVFSARKNQEGKWELSSNLL